MLCRSISYQTLHSTWWNHLAVTLPAPPPNPRVHGTRYPAIVMCCCSHCAHGILIRLHTAIQHVCCRMVVNLVKSTFVRTIEYLW